MLQHQVFPFFAGNGKTHSVWYSILHWLHFNIPFFSSGILQVQKTWMESAAFSFVCSAVLRCFVVGNANSLPCSKQSCKCFLIFFWSKTTLPGWTPLTNAVAKATANSPQFALPDCIWTSMILRSIVFCSVNKIEAICCFTNGVTERKKLSYTNTSASFVTPIVLIVSQCPWPSCRICTSSPLSMLNAHNWPKQGGCKPPTVDGTNCFRSACAAAIMLSFSHPNGSRRISLSDCESWYLFLFTHTLIGTCCPWLLPAVRSMTADEDAIVVDCCCLIISCLAAVFWPVCECESEL